MAARFWRGGSGTWDNSDTSHWSTTSGGSGGASVPGASDTVTIDINSGSLGTVITRTATATITSLVVGHGNSTLSLSSNLITSGNTTIGSGFNGGNLIANGFTIACSRFANGFGAAINLDNSTLLATNNTAVTLVNIGQSGFEQFSAIGATIGVFSASSDTRTFNFGGAGGGYANIGTIAYTGAGSTGGLVIAGDSNTFENIDFTDASNARTLTLPAGKTQTVTGRININGTSGKLMSIVSSSAGSAATLAKPSGTVSLDYVSIKDSTASGNVPFYAGANSTDVSGNTNWVFTAPPPRRSLTLLGVG